MTNLRIRPAVASLPRYVPSKTAHDAVKISSNEMPTPPSPEVLEAIARELETINRYPDLTAAPLREALAQRFGVGADQVCVGTGSSAAARALSPGSDEARAASRVLRISSTYRGALCEEGTGSSG